MASVIKAGNATDGVQVTSDNTGILELKTGTGAGTTAITVGTGQNVGVGTGSPTQLLEVSKSQNVDTVIQVTNSNSGNNATAQFYASNGSTQSQFYHTGANYATAGAITASQGGLYNNTANGFAIVAANASAPIVFATGGTTARMRISSSGQVTTPNQPAFLATRDSGNQTGLTTNSDLIFASEVYDEGSNYNTSTGVFTAPVTGKYLFTCTALFTSITNGQEIDVGLVTSNRLYFFGNPGRLEVSTGVTFGDGYISYGISQIVDMDANDTAFCEIAGLSSGTIALYSGATWSRFAGYLLG